MPKKPRKDLNELTEKQQLFVNNLTNPTSKTFSNLVTSLQSAGYKHGNNPKALAVRLLANQNILDGLLKHVNKLAASCVIRQESAKERIWQELEEALSECKTSGDMTNRLRVIELMGKFHQLWSDKVTISVETYEKMSEEHMTELLELSKLRHLRSGSVIDAQLTEPALTTIDDNTGLDDCKGVDTMLLQGQSEAIVSDDDIQDAVGDDDKADNTGMSTLHNSPQVIDNTEVM
jgi:hypothetical protein